MMSTSRHPACLMASAVRQISAFVMRTSFMCENVVGPICPALKQMPEAYWAAIATLVVMQSTLGATLTLSVERIVATAVGASVGALESNYFGANLAAFMLAIFFIGVLSFGFRLERTAYRYASVTLTIIVLIPRANPAWIVGLHRFIEVSVGIIVALAVAAFWPERSAIAAKNADV